MVVQTISQTKAFQGIACVYRVEKTQTILVKNTILVFLLYCIGLFLTFSKFTVHPLHACMDSLASDTNENKKSG